jgi:hypothetical protein
MLHVHVFDALQTGISIAVYTLGGIILYLQTLQGTPTFGQYILH